jgi:hypothetical protein
MLMLPGSLDGLGTRIAFGSPADYGTLHFCGPHSTAGTLFSLGPLRALSAQKVA